MSYKIIVDSCGELTEDMKASDHFDTVPLSIDVDGHHIVDDDTFDQADFLKKVAESPSSPKSSCPSPGIYMEKYHCDAEHIYAVTLSAELSGSYNSAVTGSNLYHDQYGDKDIYVFNSRSASCGETLIAMKIAECEEAGMSFTEVIENVERYIEGQNTYFVLESLETLRKNGRLTGIKALVAGVLNIKPIMGSTPEGSIRQLGQARGINKALVRMVDEIVSDVKGSAQKILIITHCNCFERAIHVKEMILSKIKLRNIIILDTRGISSMYANDGGIIVVV